MHHLGVVVLRLLQLLHIVTRFRLCFVAFARAIRLQLLDSDSEALGYCRLSAVPNKRVMLVASASRRAWRAGYAMILIACVLLAAMVILSDDPKFPPPKPGQRDLTSPLGWIGLVCALVLFGSIGIMVRIPSVMEACIDPMIFQVYQSLGIIFVSMVVAIYQIGSGVRLKFTWWGTLAAGIIYTAQAFAYNGVRGLGNAVGPATWAGIG